MNTVCIYIKHSAYFFKKILPFILKQNRFGYFFISAFHFDFANNNPPQKSAEEFESLVIYWMTFVLLNIFINNSSEPKEATFKTLVIYSFMYFLYDGLGNNGILCHSPHI